MSRTIKTLKDVVDWGLCIGCGACYYACSSGEIKLVNIESVGIRPQFNSDACASCTKCLSICPGYSIDANALAPATRATEAEHEFGPALEIWEGFAADPEVRHKASSGGMLSALSLFCLEQEKMGFVLHAGMDEAEPWKNVTVQSRNKKDILSRAGSRYAPASPCDKLQLVEDSDRPCVFIGKPCDTAAVNKLRAEKPELDEKLGLVLSFFCAGTPSTKGTLDLKRSMGVESTDINELRYRGEGWPGDFKIIYDDRTKQKSMSYEQSWGFLADYRSLRCHLCPDGLGRVADISCGDAWESHTQNGDPGRSIVLVRTERGRDILHRAMAAGYVELTRVDAATVLAAQPNLLQRRRELFGRLLGLKICLVPVPVFKGFSLFRSWMKIPLMRRVKTVGGTFKRVVTRGRWKRRPLAT